MHPIPTKDTPVQYSARNSRTQAQLLQLLYDQAPTSIIATPFCAILLVIGLKDAISLTPLLSWITAILLLTLSRAVLVYLYSVSPNKESKYSTWLYSYMMIEFCAGLIWCSTVLLLPQLEIIYQMFVFFAYGGMLMGATVILAPVISTYIVYSVPSTALFVTGLLQLNNPVYASMAYMTILFTAVLIYTTSLMNRRVIHSLTLSEQNLKLAQDIQSINEKMIMQIKEKDNVERKLINSRNELARVFEHMQDTYYRTDTSGRLVNVSPSVKTLLGYEPHEVIGTLMANHYAYPEQRTDFLNNLKSSNGKIKNYEAQLVTKDEHTIWVSTNAQFYTDKHGNILGIEGTTRETTQNRIAAEAIIKSKEEFKRLYEFNFKILENSPVGIMTLDERNHITYMNPALKKVLGVPQDTAHVAVDKVDISTLSSIKAANLDNTLIQLRQGETIKQESEYKSLYGKHSVIEITSIPIMENDNYKGGLCFIVDITEKAKERHKLHVAKNQAEFDNQTKEVFIEKISEELKSPLTDIMGMTDVLINKQETPDIKDDLQIILNAAKVILDYIKTINNVVKGQNGEQKSKTTETNLQRFLNTTIKNFRLEADKFGLEFNARIDESVPQNIQIDYRWFNGIIANILYDFTRRSLEGNINLSITINKNNALYIKIDHSHLHVPPQYFDTSIKNPAQSEYNVNLAISRQLVESLGGKSWVENTDSNASSINIVIPIDVQKNIINSESNEQTENKAKQQTNLRILLVEDNPASQTVIVKMLENLGHSAFTAKNGLEGVDSVKTDNFDLVLMDINLPLMDGVEATKTIRRLSNTQKADIPIIGITASSELNSQQWLKAGLNTYILKPVSLNTLNDTINTLFASL